MCLREVPAFTSGARTDEHQQTVVPKGRHPEGGEAVVPASLRWRDVCLKSAKANVPSEPKRNCPRYGGLHGNTQEMVYIVVTNGLFEFNTLVYADLGGAIRQRSETVSIW